MIQVMIYIFQLRSEGLTRFKLWATEYPCILIILTLRTYLIHIIYIYIYIYYSEDIALYLLLLFIKKNTSYL